MPTTHMRCSSSNWIAHWKWVCLYVVAIFFAGPLVGSLTTRAYRSIGSVPVGTAAFVSLIFSAAILFVLVLRKAKQYPRSFWFWAALIAISYGITLPHMGDISIEKIHFIEYGFLSYLVYMAFSKRSRSNLFWKTLSVVFIVGCADEVYQGFLPNRRYDDLDICMNLVSGFQGLLVTILAKEKKVDSVAESIFRSELVPYHGLWIAACIGYLIIHAVPIPKQEILGIWHRVGNCEIDEWLTLEQDGSFIWWDTDGSNARGRYRLSANRLEGVFLHTKVISAQHPKQCGMRPGLSMDQRVKVTPDRIVYLEDPERSWERL